MSVVYKIHLENFRKFELGCDDNALVPFFIQPKKDTFESFEQELKNRNTIFETMKAGKDFKLFYRDRDGDKIEIKDEYDFRIFLSKRVKNVTAEMEELQFDDFEDFAEYVKCFTPDNRFPGL